MYWELYQVGLDRIYIVTKVVTPPYTVEREIAYPEEDMEEYCTVFSDLFQCRLFILSGFLWAILHILDSQIS